MEKLTLPATLLVPRGTWTPAVWQHSAQDETSRPFCPWCGTIARLKWSGMDCVAPGCGWWYCL